MGTNYFLLTVFFFSFLCSAQEYSTNLIDEKLSSNARAVVRLDQSKLTLIDYDKLKIEKQYIVSIFRQDGLDFMYQPLYYDDQTKVIKYGAEVYNQKGELIKKLKKKDFKDLSATGNSTLYADNRVLVCNYTPTTYPFTIRYQFVYETTNTAFIPNWLPIDSYDVAIEKSVYSFKNESSIEVLTKKNNFEPYPIEFVEGADFFKYTLINQVPKLHEILSPALIEEVPRLLISPKKFQLAGYDATFTNWKDLGKWFYDDLIKGRQDLPQEEVLKVKELIAGIESPQEKVRVLYQYMQDKTRYINVAIGIGGWQPYPAKYVSEKGYGDCKALSNYMMALLEVAEIPSNFTIVYGDRETHRDILPDFPSMQGNHAIINVPMDNDTIWLECTSQITAFNHLGSFTNDRFALSVSKKGGEIVKTQSYPAIINTQVIEGKAKISDNGHLALNFTHITAGIQYDWNYAVYYKNEKDQKNWLDQKYGDIKSKKFESFKFTNDQNNALFIQEIALSSDVYAQSNGDNLIFRVIPVGTYNTELKKDSSREKPLEIQHGFLDESTFEFEFPSDYTLNYRPDATHISSPFGNYEMSYELQDNIIIVKRKLFVEKGRFNKDQYADYVAFRRSIEKADNTKILLEKIKIN
ncbi:MAG: transglutaminase-like domain-containing protein [Weeksellaceae bacterium]